MALVFYHVQKRNRKNLGLVLLHVIIVSAVYCTQSKTGDLYYCQCFANSIDWQGILDISIFMQ